MQNFVREGDTLFCHSMDRLARNLDDLRRIVLGLTERGVYIVFVKENLPIPASVSPTNRSAREPEESSPARLANPKAL
jgi:DNA invertase Pin-like site-specific DNA recombinase